MYVSGNPAARSVSAKPSSDVSEAADAGRMTEATVTSKRITVMSLVTMRFSVISVASLSVLP